MFPQSFQQAFEMLQRHLLLGGVVDAMVWGSSAIASLSAGPLFGVVGCPLLALMSGVLALVPLTMLARR